MLFVGSAPTPFLARFWEWLRPEFKRGQISCPFQGTGRFRIMRFIGVLRNAVKTGDEYPNRDGVWEREGGGGGRWNWSTKRRNSIHRAIFERVYAPRSSIVPLSSRILATFMRLSFYFLVLTKYECLTEINWILDKLNINVIDTHQYIINKLFILLSLKCLQYWQLLSTNIESNLYRCLLYRVINVERWWYRAKI